MKKNNIIKLNPKKDVLRRKSNYENNSMELSLNTHLVRELLIQLQVPQSKKSISHILEANRAAYPDAIKNYIQSNSDPLYRELSQLIENKKVLNFVIFSFKYPEVANIFLTREFEGFLQILQQKAEGS